MPETPTPPPPVPGLPQPQPSQQPVRLTPVAGRGPMSQEFDRPRWTLPPVVPILIAAAAVAIIVALITVTNRAKPAASGAITKIASADQQGNTMAAVQVKIDNKIEKQIWIKDVSSELETADGRKYTDHAAASVDSGRYLKAFPPLQEAQADPLREELKIPSGASFTGFAIFAYPVNKEVFDARKSLTVRIELYDQSALVIKQ